MKIKSIDTGKLYPITDQTITYLVKEASRYSRTANKCRKEDRMDLAKQYGHLASEYDVIALWVRDKLKTS